MDVFVSLVEARIIAWQQRPRLESRICDECQTIKRFISYALFLCVRVGATVVLSGRTEVGVLVVMQVLW